MSGTQLPIAASVKCCLDCAIAYRYTRCYYACMVVNQEVRLSRPRMNYFTRSPCVHELVSQSQPSCLTTKQIIPLEIWHFSNVIFTRIVLVFSVLQFGLYVTVNWHSYNINIFSFQLFVKKILAGSVKLLLAFSKKNLARFDIWCQWMLERWSLALICECFY